MSKGAVTREKVGSVPAPRLIESRDICCNMPPPTWEIVPVEQRGDRDHQPDENLSLKFDAANARFFVAVGCKL